MVYVFMVLWVLFSFGLIFGLINPAAALKDAVKDPVKHTRWQVAIRFGLPAIVCWALTGAFAPKQEDANAFKEAKTAVQTVGQEKRRSGGVPQDFTKTVENNKASKVVPLSHQQVLQGPFGEYFPEVIRGAPVDGLLNYVGRSTSGNAQIQLVGDKRSLKSASLLLKVTGGEAHNLAASVLTLGFIGNVLPGQSPGRESIKLVNFANENPNQKKNFSYPGRLVTVASIGDALLISVEAQDRRTSRNIASKNDHSSFEKMRWVRLFAGCRNQTTDIHRIQGLLDCLEPISEECMRFGTDQECKQAAAESMGFK
ncbi:hypothetical protein WDW86_10285 [Bdellovibrionota bacterium FG-2]